TCVQFLYEHCAKTGEMDPIVLFFLLASLYLLIRSEQRPSYLFASFALMGLSSLTKNFAGFILFGLSFLYLVVTGKWRLYSWKHLVGGILIFLFLSFSWMLAMIAIHGKEFLHEFLIDQSYDRIVSEQYKSGVVTARSFSGGFWFVAQTFFNGAYPWG